MGREVELKLEVEPGDVGRLKRHPALKKVAAREQAQLSVYFDTPHGKLRKAGYSLRVRRAGECYIQTVKPLGEAAGLFDRPEWEAEVAELRPEAGAAEESPLGSILPAKSWARLKPTIRSEVRRTIWPLQVDSAEIELILDQGIIRSGDREQLLHEIELELRQGEIAAVIELARALGARVPLRIGVLTKAERGFGLADGSLFKVRKAPATHLDESMTAAEGFAAIILSCLRHFRLNEPLLVERRDAGALHQARVAMRRLRSALSLFRPMLRKDPEFARLREELRWFTDQLGEARNLDVFLKRVEEDDRARAKLLKAREASYTRIIATLASKRFRTMMLELVAWLATGEWRQSKRGRRSLRSFTNKRIDALWHDIAARGEHIAQLEEEPRHRLRIDIKKIRYALEFVRGLHAHESARQKRFGSALEGLQESLGELNDMATAREMTAHYLGRGDEPAAGTADAEEAAHLKQAKRHFARLKKVGPYWRDPPTNA